MITPKTHQQKIIERKARVLAENFDVYGDGVASLNMQKAKESGYIAECLKNIGAGSGG